MRTKTKSTHKNYTKNTTREDKFITQIIKSIALLNFEKWETFHKSISNSFPVNGITKRKYKGFNSLVLFIDIISNKYVLNDYLTFNQIKKLNGRLKKGSKGVTIEFYSIVYKDDYTKKTIQICEYDLLSDADKKDYRRVTILKSYYVFNLSCIENYEEFKVNLTKEIEQNYNNDVEERPEKEVIINNLITSKELILKSHLQARAYYSVTHDEIFIPKKELFKSTDDYYYTLFHELTHWTGNEKRLNRPLQGMNDVENYAFEELIAELGTLLIHFHFGEATPLKNSLVYLKGWLNKTNEEDKESNLRKAFAESQKAVKYILY